MSYDKIGVNPSDFDLDFFPLKEYFSAPPMFFTKDMAAVPFVGRFQGASAFLIAGGPSFANVNKSLLLNPGVFTMGINNSPKTFRPNFWICVDSPSSFLMSIWKDPKIEKIVPISHRNKKLFDSIKWKDTGDLVGDCPNVFYYRRNEVVNTDQYCHESTVNWGNHSNIGGGRSVFLAAIRILYLYGFKNVYLLGADFNMDEKKHYHFPQERANGSIRNNMNTYSSMNKWFTTMNKDFKALDFNVFNCNPESKLTAFEFIKFEDAIARATKNFPVPEQEKTSGMYTKEADAEHDRKIKEAKIAAAKYTEEDRKAVKVELDAKRSALNKAKDDVNFHLTVFKTPPDAEKIKEMMISKSKPTDQDGAKLYDLKLIEEEMRVIFRECEKRKNMIWGIVR